MRTLLLETSDRRAAVGVADNDGVRATQRLGADRRHARDLAPTIRDLLDEVGWPAGSLERVFVNVGPGSYTGLRVGVMTAKTLGFAAGAAVLGVTTPQLLAAQAPQDVDELAVVIDAQQKQLYVARFHRDDTGRLVPVAELTIRSRADVLAEATPDVWFTGPALHRDTDEWQARRLLPEPLWLPDVATLARLGIERWARGDRDDPLTLEPLYLRGSSAEINWDARHGNR